MNSGVQNLQQNPSEGQATESSLQSEQLQNKVSLQWLLPKPPPETGTDLTWPQECHMQLALLIRPGHLESSHEQASRVLQVLLSISTLPVHLCCLLRHSLASVTPSPRAGGHSAALHASRASLQCGCCQQFGG